MMAKQVFLVIAMLICSISCFAQQYPLVHYTPKDGLVNSRVRRAFQDSKGKLYFMTYGGLSVYDGIRFKNYTTQDGFHADLVNDVIEITPDSLLISSNECGLFTLVRGILKPLDIDSEHCPVVNQFLPTPEGDIYTSADDGLYQLKGNTFIKCSPYLSALPSPILYLGSLVNTGRYIVTASNELLSYRGLYLFDKTTKTFVDALPEIGVGCVTQDASGIIWIITSNSIVNLDTLALAEGHLKTRPPYAIEIAPNDQLASDITFTQDGDILLSTGIKGIVRYKQDGTRTLITSDEVKGMPIQEIFIDKENSIWFCNDGNGLYKLSNTHLRFDVPITNNKSGVRLMMNIGHDSIFLIMFDQSLLLKSATGIKSLTYSPAFNLNMLHVSGQELFAAEHHILYHGHFPDEQHSQITFKPILTIPDTTAFGGASLPYPGGLTFLIEKSHVLVYHGDQSKFTLPINVMDLVQSMFFDNDFRLWIVFRHGGVYLCSIHPDDQDHLIHVEKIFKDELENISPRCAMQDNQGLIWIGSRSHGVVAYAYSEGELIKRFQLRTQDGLTDNFVTCVAIDSSNHILIGTQTGLDRLIKTGDTYRIENLTKSRNQFAYIQQIWVNSHNQAYIFTNSGGVLEVDPAVEVNTTFIPQLEMEEIKVNGEAWPYSNSPLQFNYKQRNISFLFAAPTFIDEDLVQYSYRVTGHGEQPWSTPSHTGEVHLVNLPPGKYKLHIKAAFPSSPYQDQYRSFSFEILPAWWQTIWFLLTMSGLIAMGLFFIIRAYYRRKLYRQQTEAEKQKAVEKERTRIATDMHDDLGAGLSRIRFLGETIDWKNSAGQSVAEDIGKIKTYSHEMIDKMGEIVWALNEKNDSVEDLLSYVRAYAVDYLSQHGISCQVEVHEPDHPTWISGEVRRNVFLTMKEALHNVVKHANATSVKLKLNAQQILVINLADNGIGFNPHQIRSFSNGLANMKRRMQEIGGTLVMQSDQGTSVELRIPFT